MVDVKAHLLKPDSELLVGGTSVALVLAIFAQNTPNLADVRAATPGDVNTHKSVKLAAITSFAAVGALALLGKSPTVMVIGGAAILFETWKYHFANYASNGTAENNQAGYKA
jgi:hypothetical protein